jgi:hypothetical protein
VPHHCDGRASHPRDAPAAHPPLRTFQPARETGVLTTATREFIHMLISEGDLHHVPQAIL